MPLLSGLVAFWNLNDGTGTTATDSTGSYNGTLSGTATWISTGILGSCLSLPFSGMVYVPHNSIFNFTNQFSVGFWMRNSSTQNAFPIEKRDNGGVSGWMFQKPNPSGLFFQVRGQTSEQSVEIYFNNIDNQWDHVVGTYDGVSRLYINGSLLGSSAGGGGNLRYDEDTLFIGANGGSISFFSGLIDEVGIWDRTLTGSEVLNLYNSGNGLSYRFRGTSLGISPLGNTLLTSGTIDL